MKTRALALFAVAALSTASCANDDGSSAANIVSVPGGGHFGARGLIGLNDNHATFDTTTGAFDTIGAPGDIASLDLTVFNNDGSVNVRRSISGINAAAYSFALDGLEHGTRYRISAHVSGMVPGPFSDVALDGSIRFRPDIAIGPAHNIHGIVGPDRSRGNGPQGNAFGNDGIVGPDRVRVGRSITITTLVSEKNGETGATTDCVLGIVGPDHTALPSQSVPVTVAAGGTAYCQFTTSFPTTGEYLVTLEAQNITPNDVVIANNKITFPMSIVGPDRTR